MQAVPLCKALTAESDSVVPSQYTGVDMSRAALVLAEHNVQRAVPESCETAFHEEDMLSFLQSPDCKDSYDVSFVLDPHQGRTASTPSCAVHYFDGQAQDVAVYNSSASS